jgi:hypothetical protein
LHNLFDKQLRDWRHMRCGWRHHRVDGGSVTKFYTTPLPRDHSKPRVSIQLAFHSTVTRANSGQNWVLSPDERRRSWISGRLSTKFPPSSLQRPVCGWERTGDENTRRSVGRISWAITQRQLIHPAQLGVVKSACSELGQHLSRLYNGGPTSFLFFLSNEEHSIFNRSSGNKKNTVTAYRKKEQKTVLFHCERNKAADYIIIHTAGVISIEQTFTSEKTERKKKKKTKKKPNKKGEQTHRRQPDSSTCASPPLYNSVYRFLSFSLWLVQV